MRTHVTKPPVLLALAALLCACAAETGPLPEPPVPTTDPRDHIRLGMDSWKAEKNIALASGDRRVRAVHAQTVFSGLHTVDFRTPPAAFVAVKPSCDLPKAEGDGPRYMVVGNGATSHALTRLSPKERAQDRPYLHMVTQDVVGDHAKDARENHTRDGVLPPTETSLRDIAVTDTSGPVHIVLGVPHGIVQNFVLAPGVEVASVYVYSDTGKVGVAGLPADTPVHFILRDHGATRHCHVRTVERPDTKRRDAYADRAETLEPVWRTFRARAERHVGRIPEDHIVSGSSFAHALLGPAPDTYEARLPYRALAGKTVIHPEAYHVEFGNGDAARRVLDAVVKAELGVGAGQ